MTLDVIGFGSLNLDEFWEVPQDFLRAHALEPGKEYVRDVAWFAEVYPELQTFGTLKGRDPGGSAANMIAALARMGFRTGFFGSAGREDAPLLRLDELGRSEDLRVSLRELPAGRCLALIADDDPHRDRALVILPNANSLAGSDDLDVGYFAQAKWVHLTSFVADGPLAAQISLVERLPSHVQVSFDPGAVYVARRFSQLAAVLRKTAVLFVAEEELMELTDLPDRERAVTLLLGMGVATVVVKLGAQGIMAFEKDAHYLQPAVAPATIKDRTGAGDVAAAGFMAGLIRGFDLRACLGIAATAASRSLEGFGRSAYPDERFFREIASRLRSGTTAA
ncbi:MAG: carbohydrate kinase family protein [Thermodesulfobacteriota bacterium]